jgi:urease accessory protein
MAPRSAYDGAPVIVLASSPAATHTLGPAATSRAVVGRVGGRSVVRRAFASSPLRLLTPSNHGHAAWIFTSTFGGGLVGGDALKVDVRVEAGACAALLTQASTKVYRSPLGASMDFHASVADGALLVVLPDPVVPFARSSYGQRQDVRLDGGGSLVLVDWVTAGRRAVGERWQFDRYASRLAVRQGDRPLLMDATMLDAADGSIAARMGRFETLCTVVLAGAQVAPAAAGIVAQVSEQPVVPGADQLVSAAPLAGGGALVRLAGTSVESVARAVRDLLAFLPPMLGDNPWLRKW